MAAQALLIRPGSLNPAGPWTPARENHRPESLERLIDTLRPIAAQAQAAGVLLVIEAHATSIMDSPEICRTVVEAIGTPNLRLTMDVVNGFQTFRQVYISGDRIDHIFNIMGDIAPVAHIKDIVVRLSMCCISTRPCRAKACWISAGCCAASTRCTRRAMV